MDVLERIVSGLYDRAHEKEGTARDALMFLSGLTDYWIATPKEFAAHWSQMVATPEQEISYRYGLYGGGLSAIAAVLAAPAEAFGSLILPLLADTYARLLSTHRSLKLRNESGGRYQFASAGLIGHMRSLYSDWRNGKLSKVVHPLDDDTPAPAPAPAPE